MNPPSNSENLPTETIESLRAANQKLSAELTATSEKLATAQAKSENEALMRRRGLNGIPLHLVDDVAARLRMAPNLGREMAIEAAQSQYEWDVQQGLKSRV